MITTVHVTATVTSFGLGALVVMGGPGWTHYAVTAWRTVLAHVAVLVALVKRRRDEELEWEESPLAHADESGWEDDPDTLRELPVVRVPDQTTAEPVQSGRHSKGEAAA